MKFREFDRYRAFYCGLCRTIGKEYSYLGRMALSFEMAFLSMLLTALYETETKEDEHRCFLHPIKKQPMLHNDIIEYCAGLGVMTAYYDLIDGWEDDKRVDRLAESAVLKKAAAKAAKRYPRQSEAIIQYVESLHKVEKSNEQNLDAAANLTGEMLSELFVMKEDEWVKDLREMGFYIGKFIYLCDCYEDLEKDEKKKSYNPLLSRKGSATFDLDCEQMLSDMMSRACRAFERLPILQDAEILRNILYSGIWLHFENAAVGRKESNKA